MIVQFLDFHNFFKCFFIYISYAADAVKYPLTQEKNSLYAGVENKKKGAFRKDSTSGYPDVVMGVRFISYF